VKKQLNSTGQSPAVRVSFSLCHFHL